MLKTPRSSFLSSALLVAAAFSVVTAVACADGGTGEPEPETGGEPEAEPEPLPERLMLGGLTIRILDDAGGELCSTTFASTEQTYDHNFIGGYSYFGDPQGESMALLAGTSDTADFTGPIGQISFLMTQASDGVFDLPPSTSYTYTLATASEFEGSVSCGTATDGEIGPYYSLAFTSDTMETLTSFSSAVSSAEAAGETADGNWSTPLPVCNTEMHSVDSCEIFDADVVMALDAAGSGVDALDGQTYQFEVSFAADSVPMAASRAAP